MSNAKIVRVGINFSLEEAISTFAHKNQHKLLTDLYKYTHHGKWSSISFDLDYVMDGLIKYLGLTEDDLERILGYGQPNNIGEEEISKLSYYRGALTNLTHLYLVRSNLPEDSKAQFGPENKVLEKVLLKAEKWYEAHPDQNVPIQLDQMFKDRIERVYRRAQELVEFYNSKKPLYHLSKYHAGEGFDYGIEGAPLFIIFDFYSLFAPSAEKQREFADLIGWEIPSDEEFQEDLNLYK